MVCLLLVVPLHDMQNDERLHPMILRVVMQTLCMRIEAPAAAPSDPGP
jgi:hypothetical protein